MKQNFIQDSQPAETSLCDAAGATCFNAAMKDVSVPALCTKCLGDCDTVSLLKLVSCHISNIF